MSDNTLTSVVRTPDSATGYTLVERWLDEKLLEEREFNTPLAQSKFSSDRNLPKNMGQYVKLTRRRKIRLPEVAKENLDPLSSAQVAYDQYHVPIEWLNDYAAFSRMSVDTSWLDIMQDFKDLSFEGVRRYMNRATQAAFLVGRYKPGYRNSSGNTIAGDATYPSPWTTVEASPSLYGVTFNFQAAPTYFANRKTNWGALTNQDYATMDDFRRLRVNLANAGARTIDGKYVAVISDSVKADLERSDEYFQAAIRSASASKNLFNGELADYAGFRWVMDDEPFTLNAGGTDNVLTPGGNVHVCQVLGQDAFAYLRLGGRQTVRPGFKVQDITKTGSTTTIGYMFPFAVAVTNPDWCMNYKCAVRDFTTNNA